VVRALWYIFSVNLLTRSSSVEVLPRHVGRSCVGPRGGPLLDTFFPALFPKARNLMFRLLDATL
jgi:hypothetical protein